MAKYQKLDSKQMPQVVVLAVLCVGVVGYGGYSLLSMTPKSGTPANAAEKKSAPQVATANPAGTLPAGPGVAAPNAVPAPPPGFPLPTRYDPEPFRPKVKGADPNAPRSAPQPTPTVRPAPPLPPTPGADFFPGTSVRPVPQVQPEGTGPTAPAEPAVERPDIVVAGIMDVTDRQMAIIEVANTQYVVQPGDLVGPHYHIRKIARDGVLLASPKARDKFFVGLGPRKTTSTEALYVGPPSGAPKSEPKSSGEVRS